MKIFITGTDTNVGKTIISSWLCAHSGYDYCKPIQTGGDLERDCLQISQLSGVKIHAESYLLQDPVSPHLAASKENINIDLEKIILPEVDNLIIEGAGGVLVPLNEKALMIDLIKWLNVPVIVVARTSLGTINHTLLTLKALQMRKIPILGVILKGDHDADNARAIAHYGKVKILVSVPHFDDLNVDALKKFPFSSALTEIFKR
ncbi:MAG: dethiobiotin synthase [Janthinobacterium lividum]